MRCGDDELVGGAPSSPLFTQEREEPANLRQTYRSQEESFLPARPFFTGTSTKRPVYEPRRDLETSESGFSLKGKKEQILAEVRSEIQKHEFQADSV